MADLLLLRGGEDHRERAFRTAAKVLEALPEPAETLMRRGALERVPGLGEGTVHRVKQLLATGTTDDLQRLRAALPSGLREMLELRGVGARTVRVLWSRLRIDSIDALEAAARSGKLLDLPRLGPGIVHRILQSIDEFRLERAGKRPFIEARRVARTLVRGLEGHVERIAICGSIRRGKAMCGDLDLLVGSHDGGPVAARFVTLPEVERVLFRGDGRVEVLLHDRQQVDLRIVAPEQFGAGLHYLTGSALHNIALRTRALRYGIKVSDDGLFVRDTTQLIDPGTTEEAIFAAARLPFIPPELRENTGEIEAAAEGRLQRLVEAADLMGDLHMHTRASDGRGTAREMVDAALALGHRYVAITDHSKALSVANGLDEARLLAQIRHLRALQEEVGERIQVLAGVEVDILGDGALDLDVGVLDRCDWVIASVHSGLDDDATTMTDRMIRAMESGVVDAIGHPTNRRLGERRASALDFDRLFAAAARTGVALEINGNPHRMDLDDNAARSARQAGVGLVINTDSHAPHHLPWQEYGLLPARRGGIAPADVWNCAPFGAMADRRRQRKRSANARVSVSAWEPSAELYVGKAASAHYQADDGPDRAQDGDDANLVERLRGPLDDALRTRLDDWMRNGGDAALEDALSTWPGHPMATAFGLLTTAPVSPDGGP